MTNSAFKFNVIWVDDDIDSLYDDLETKRALKKRGISIIAKAHTYQEFEEYMNILYDRVDAVISDANFNKNKLVPNNERDLSGFEKMRESIQIYNTKRDIPFYVYSARGEYLADRYDNDELEYFEVNNRLFDKEEFVEMLDRIVEDVKHINSPTFRVCNKYAAELSAASKIAGNEEFLLNALLYDYTNDWKDVEEYFNPARKLIERIFDKCKDLMIIPNGVTELNAFHGLLDKGSYDIFTMTQGVEIIPKPLLHSLKYLLDITQDGSHSKKDLKLGVDLYVKETMNINLFRSILYIAMDMCLWYEKYSLLHPDRNINKSNWQIDTTKFAHIGEFKILNRNKYVCDNYQIIVPYGTALQCNAGDEIGIKLNCAKEHNRKFSYTSEDNRNIEVDKCVFDGGWVVVGKRK